MKKNKDTFVKAKVNISITPGEMLKTLRELQGLSQRQLADGSRWGQIFQSDKRFNSSCLIFNQELRFF
ncbi:MAG: hypothetical protein ACUZ8N_14085 [Candidatus Scalindua sp.]